MRIGRRGGGVAGLLVLLALVLLADAGDRDDRSSAGRGEPADAADDRGGRSLGGGRDAGNGRDREGTGTAAPGTAADAMAAEVSRVIDGDTIEVELDDGASEDVRYIGVDTPETVKPGTPVECFGKQASRFNERLVAGRRVRLVFDRERRDRYGRLLAYVYAGGSLVNAELVRGGYARTLEIEPNTALAARLARLERAAGEAGRGLWSAC